METTEAGVDTDLSQIYELFPDAPESNQATAPSPVRTSAVDLQSL